MKVRRYKYIYTEIVEEEHTPKNHRLKVLSVPLRSLKLKTPLYNSVPLPPEATQPNQAGQLRPLLRKSLPLAALSILGLLIMTVLACTLVGLFNLPTSEQNVVFKRRLAVVSQRLPTFTPTPVAAQSVVPLPTPAAADAALPSLAPTASPVSLPTPANASAAPPPAAGSQNNRQPTLTSLVDLNVRSGPGLEHGLVGKLTAGQSTGVTGQNPDGSWWQIEYPSGSGRQAWVSADPQYSTVSQPMPQTIAQAATPVSPAGAGLDPTTPTAAGSSPPLLSTTDAAGWTFNGVTQLAGNAEAGLLLMGELVNGTGAPQQVIDISGAFYDAQGEVAADSLELVSYVPVDPVPVNAHVPFELLVSGHQDIDRFDLHALSEPASDPPRQDFQFSDIDQWVDDATGYCLRGQVDNLGPPVQEYLIVLAIGYDDQGRVVNFGEYYVDTLPGGGGQGSPFELCLASLGRQLSRHDLRAFGY